MPDSVVSSPLTKSIDPRSFSDIAAVNASKSIDPSSLISTSAERRVYDSPPTAADQETLAPSEASESRQKTGDKLNVNNAWFRDWKRNNILNRGIILLDLFRLINKFDWQF